MLRRNIVDTGKSIDEIQGKCLGDTKDKQGKYIGDTKEIQGNA